VGGAGVGFVFVGAAPYGEGLFELVEQGAIHIAFAGLLGHEVPEMADLRLANAVDATEALLQAVGVPWQVVVDHQVGALQVDALARCVGSEQPLHLRVVPARLLGLQALLTAQAAVDKDHRVLAPEQRAHAGVEIAQRVAVLGENDELLAR